MNKNDFSALLECDLDSLEHYGVKGMKWGVWNDETKAKYNGGMGRASNAMKAKLSQAGSAVGSGAKAVKRFTGKSMASAKAQVATMAGNSKAKREAKKAEKKDIAEQRKELGMTRVEYNKLRDKTLKSHDPQVIAKGMHTLTDTELKEKISRLNEEDKIVKMANERASRAAEVSKKRNEALDANPLVKVGKTVALKYANGKIDQLLGKGASAKVEQTVAEAAEKVEKQKEQPKKEPVNKSTPDTQFSNTTVYGSSRVPDPNYDTVRTDFTRKLLTGTVETPAAKETASKGKSYVDSDVFDAKVTSSGSERAGTYQKPSKYSSAASAGKKWWDLEGKNVIDNDDIPDPNKKKKD